MEVATESTTISEVPAEINGHEVATGNTEELPTQNGHLTEDHAESTFSDNAVSPRSADLDGTRSKQSPRNRASIISAIGHSKPKQRPASANPELQSRRKTIGSAPNETFEKLFADSERRRRARAKMAGQQVDDKRSSKPADKSPPPKSPRKSVSPDVLSAAHKKRTEELTKNQPHGMSRIDMMIQKEKERREFLQQLKSKQDEEKAREEQNQSFRPKLVAKSPLQKAKEDEKAARKKQKREAKQKKVEILQHISDAEKRLEEDKEALNAEELNAIASATKTETDRITREITSNDAVKEQFNTLVNKLVNEEKKSKKDAATRATEMLIQEAVETAVAKVKETFASRLDELVRTEQTAKEHSESTLREIEDCLAKLSVEHNDEVANSAFDRMQNDIEHYFNRRQNLETLKWKRELENCTFSPQI
eukprot:GILK01003570.1.p1 GENE.GILK01003570.1~~GILK01003570.1.p1  ORF type:complete len:444 (-),score=105.25 GILK01003570.1:329-1594(-)